MAVPPGAFKFKAAMDPGELLDYQIRLKDGGLRLLDDAESIASYTLTLYPEAVALGLEISSAAGYTPSNDTANITIWFQVASAFRENAAYSGEGATLAMELTVITTSVPVRRRQRTIVLGVAQL